jgi:hypothetical protein
MNGIRNKFRNPAVAAATTTTTTNSNNNNNNNNNNNSEKPRPMPQSKRVIHKPKNQSINLEFVRFKLVVVKMFKVE